MIITIFFFHLLLSLEFVVAFFFFLFSCMVCSVHTEHMYKSYLLELNMMGSYCLFHWEKLSYRSF